MRSATRFEDVLEVVAEQARLLADARHAWAATFDGGVMGALRSSSDDSESSLEGAPPAAVPPLPALLAAAHPVTRSGDVLAAALQGAGGHNEGVVAIKLDAPRSRGQGADPEDLSLELVLGQLAIVGGLALEAARLRHRVEAVTRAREALLASVSHDLRNPLNTFAMSAGLLRDDLERNDVDSARGLALVSRMDRATSRMQGLIEDLVEASRIDARKIDYAFRPEKASQLVRDAATAAAAIASEKGASVTLDTLEDDSRVLVDRARTLQVLAKVIAFEAKSTGDGGTIRLGVTRQGETVVFTARAFGPGGMNVAAPEEGRGGLALLLARGLVEAQKGAFRVEGSEGLTIAFSLPLASP